MLLQQLFMVLVRQWCSYHHYQARTEGPAAESRLQRIFGVDYIPKGVYDVMDADQYSQYLGQACANSNTPLPGGYSLDSATGKYHFQDNTNTDWFDEVFKQVSARITM